MRKKLTRSSAESMVDGIIRDARELRSRTLLVTGLAPGLSGALDPEDQIRTPWSYRPRMEVWSSILEKQVDGKKPAEILDEICELYVHILRLQNVAVKNCSTPTIMIKEYIDNSVR